MCYIQNPIRFLINTSLGLDIDVSLLTLLAFFPKLTMTPILLPRVLDGGAPNMNALGISYIVLAVIYTFAILGELYLLYLFRLSFCIQIRKPKVVSVAVVMLHIYLILVLLVYPENGAFPCSAEFWIMSIFLPLGMSFFQGTHETELFRRSYQHDETDHCQHATLES